MVVAGLQCNIALSIARACKPTQCLNLGMGLTGLCVPTFSNYFIAIDHNTTNSRVWIRRIIAASSKLECARHIGVICLSPGQFLSPLGCNRWISFTQLGR